MLCVIAFSCKKKKDDDTTLPAPQEPYNYRNAYAGNYEGVQISYYDVYDMLLNPPSVTRTEQNPVNCTLTISKVINSDSLIFVKEFSPAVYSLNDSILIHGNGTFYESNQTSFSQVIFRNDSVLIETNARTAAGNVVNGIKYRCKKK